MSAHPVRAARVYDAPRPDDGTRVLVDRLWPRGLSKAESHVDRWLKAIAPSKELRQWYGHDPAKHEEFVRRYRAELAEEDRAAALAELRALLEESPVTLLTATKDLEISQATVLVDELA